jgi:hypothetical protein
VYGLGESDGYPQAKVSAAERWAGYVAAHASGAAWAIVWLCVGGVWFALSRDWFVVVVFVPLAILYWERAGFRRLLERRDAEIARLRSHGDTT